MKKVILILTVILTITTVYSQTEKGKKYIGGGISLNSISDSYLDTLNRSNSSSFRFELQPYFGYFITNNLAVSAKVSFGINNSTRKYKYSYTTPDENTSKLNTISLGAGVFAHYYKKIFDKCYFGLNGGFMYYRRVEKLKLSNSDPNYVYPSFNPANQETIANDYGITIYPNFTYFMTPQLGIFTSFGTIGYSKQHSVNNSLKFDNHINSSSFSLNLSIATLGFGVNYYF